MSSEKPHVDYIPPKNSSSPFAGERFSYDDLVYFWGRERDANKHLLDILDNYQQASHGNSVAALLTGLFLGATTVLLYFAAWDAFKHIR